MIIEIKIPSPGESITEVEVGKWLVEDGAIVRNGQEIAEIESDKATLSVSAPASGKLTILAKEGERIAVGSVACTLDTEDNIAVEEQKPVQSEIKKPEQVIEKPIQTESQVSKVTETIPAQAVEADQQIKLTPAAKAVMDEEGLSIDELLNGLRRISRKDVETVIALRNSQPVKKEVVVEISREEDRVAMTPLRRKLSQRLVAVKNETAMLTTFNEIDLSQLMELRNKYQKQFVDKYGLKVGFMSFFTKAASIALSNHPSINSMIDRDDIITPRYHDIGIAVQTPKGLMVPVVRNAETKSI